MTLVRLQGAAPVGPAQVGMTASDLFGGIAGWLLERALHEGALEETVRDLGRRLVAGGVPVCRINVGGLVLHPVLGALDITWDGVEDTCRSQSIPRAVARTEEFRNAPFYHLARERLSHQRHRLCEDGAEEAFPLLGRLRAAGMTDYLALYESFGRSNRLDWADLPSGAEGAMISFATRRIGGFVDEEIAALRALAAPAALAVKVASDRSLAEALLETYLGRVSGRRVLAGWVEKGQGRLIDCALWFSDLRGSTALAAELEMDAYLATINDYFDCTAGAVLDHGGEVLKFVGDGVMAIFPFEAGTRPPDAMCAAAARTAGEALARGRARNAARAECGEQPIRFGIGLHAGRVIYGNVGTARRLDLTVTGPAANEVDRLEQLTKTLGVPVVASRAFASLYPGELAPLGCHAADGLDARLEVLTLAELAEAEPHATAP